MYSGSDSNESQKFHQWTLNPATYQNMSNEQVDWAALAQQWIIMKEAGPPPVPGEAPISYNKEIKKDDKSGASSAEVQKEKGHAAVGALWNANEPPPGSEPWNWNAQGQNWNYSWVSPAVPPPPNIGPMTQLKPPLLPTPGNGFGITPDTEADNSLQFSNSEYTSPTGGYWTGTPSEAASTTKHIKPHNKRYSKVNVPVRVSAPLPPAPVESPPTLDANKRKQLPAWIREGLEKMEKDKLKQLEKEKQKKQREEYLENNKKNEKETMEILKSTMKERQKSKFESDGEESDEEPKTRTTAPRAPSPEPVPLTPEELIMKVRRTMTEILLTVTNRHIEAICKEELQRFVKRHKASDLRSAAPTGGANLSAKLGLGMYGEGSDSSSEDDDENSQGNYRDSDDELKEIIRRKKADFQRTEREIEERLEETDRRKVDSRSRSSTPESNDNDSQVDARAEDQRYKQNDYPSPVNKSYEKSKNKSPTSNSDVSDSSNDRSQKRSRSSSSDSDDSYKKSKSKYRSKSKSYSPDRRHRSSRWSRSKSPVRERDSTGSRRDSGSSRKKSSRRSRSTSYSRSRRSRSSSYRRSRRSNSRDRSRRTRSRSTSRSRYSTSRSERKKRRRSRSDSSSRGKRSHRH